jgi:hypothetical protein
LSRCKDLCLKIEEDQMSDNCLKTCMDAGSECEKYKTCKPEPRTSYSYVCGDGSAPEDNGCCGFQTGEQACPKLCDKRETYIIRGPAGGVRAECLCEGCPESTDQNIYKWNKTVKDNLWKSGQNVLLDIARAEGLELGPTRDMQVLMKVRNEKIKQEIEKHRGPYNEALEAKIEKVAEEYHTMIMNVAKDVKHCQTNPNDEKCKDQALSREVSMSFTMLNVDFEQLTAQHKQEINGLVTSSITSTTGVTASEVGVALSAGSVQVAATISGPYSTTGLGAIADTLKELNTATLAANVSKINGLPTTGQVSITTVEAAVRPKATRPPPIEDRPDPRASTYASNGSSSDGEEDNMMIMILIVVCVVVGALGAGAIGIVVIRRNNAKAQQPAQQVQAQPIVGDSTVVMGRPIEAGAAAGVANKETTSSGAPVQMADTSSAGAKGSKE